MTDWIYAPQMIWSLYVLIDCVRLGKVGPVGLGVYLALFVVLLGLTGRWCERQEREERRQRDRQREREER